jgi:hypothetical protein
MPPDGLQRKQEHACMTLEWIRHNDPSFHALLRRVLFEDGPRLAPATTGGTTARRPEIQSPEPTWRTPR